MKKTAFAIMFITVASKILGFVREIALSYIYGASTITDAYLISLTIPGVVFSFIGAGLGTGFIPMYSRIKEEQGVVAANRFTNNIINGTLLFSSIVVLMGLIFARPLVRIFASGFGGEAQEITIQFTRISIFAIYFTGLAGIYSGYLRLHDSHLVPNLTGIPMNVIIILSVFISSKTTVYALLLGTLLARALEVLLMAPFAKKKGFQYEPVLDLRDENLRSMVAIALPVIVGVSVNQINVLVDRTLASQIAVGGISALNYASRLNGFIQGLFVLPVSSVMYPMISSMASRQNLGGLKNMLTDAIGIINLMVTPATIGAIIFAEPIVELLFGQGAFTSEASAMTSSALRFYSIGMLAIGIREILTRAFYALQDTKIPMQSGVIAVGINVVLNVILARFLGIGGLALATSIANVVATVHLLLALARSIGEFGLREIAIPLGKVVLASTAMGFIALATYRYVGVTLSHSLSLAAAIGVGALSYFILIYFLSVPEAERAFEAVKRLFRGKKGESRGRNHHR